jgi:hypothetical protein
LLSAAYIPDLLILLPLSVVYSKDVNTLLNSFSWESDKISNGLSNKMNQWLDSISVPIEERPESEECIYICLVQHKYDYLIMFFNKNTNVLYVVESFI